ncbi:MAG TPA: manganese-binding transcriptional regulator MntR [Pirellulaceae bacterium]|jgi:DtxR family manganese transport transcriptional regulator|nr:manganese-binding transcriptional regulator MntR [Pirellulaceae bacterium]
MTERQTPDPHERTRRDHASETAEDYVEAIDDLLAAEGSCRVTDLARRFGVSHVTVTRTVARLQRDGLAETVPYGPIGLTEEGRALARNARERHRAVVQFLVALGVSAAQAQIDAEGIEHHVSDETLAAMARFVARDGESRGAKK